jgi:hypothetical protein
MPIKTRSIIYLVLAATVALLIWMGLAHVDEVVSGSAKPCRRPARRSYRQSMAA